MLSEMMEGCLIRSWKNQDSFCDVKLKLGDGTSIKAHSPVLTGISDFFAAIFDRKLDPQSNERKVWVINLQNDRPGIIRLLLHMIYTDASLNIGMRLYFAEVYERAFPAYGTCEIAVEIYLAAEKYVSNQADFEDEAMAWIDSCLISPRDIVRLAKKIFASTNDDSHRLRKWVMDNYENQFRMCLQRVRIHGDENRRLRGILSHQGCNAMDCIRTEEEYEEFRKVLLLNPVLLRAMGIWKDEYMDEFLGLAEKFNEA